MMPASDPANRLGIDYRSHALGDPLVPIIDAHTHVRGPDDAELFFEVASLFGVECVWSMTPLDEVDLMRARFPGRIESIAVPQWRKFTSDEAFRTGWMRDLDEFAAKGSRICKFWMAPRMRAEHGITLDKPFMQPVIRRAVELGFHFMTHIADPTIWWRERYADAARYGTKREQFDQLTFLLGAVSDRVVIGAHMGGSLEELDFLQSLLDRYPNYVIDSSATKWIVRETARQPQAVRDFLIAHQDRVLFGSDVVVAPHFGFDHYCSRYWSLRTMWETDYRGESPIEDPDAEGPPMLAGLDLPADVLRKLYRENAQRVRAKIGF
jgi:predicted TIM-barrel fold metal-dependent hydrolase